MYLTTTYQVYHGGKEDQDIHFQWGETKLAHVVQEVLVKAHHSRMKRHSSRRPRDQVRRQGPPRRVEHDALL